MICQKQRDISISTLVATGWVWSSLGGCDIYTRATNNGEEQSQGTITFKTYMQYLTLGASPAILVLLFGVLAVGEVVLVISVLL